MGSLGVPVLKRYEKSGLAFWRDERAAAFGISAIFSERSGGVSTGPFASLNLSTSVGDSYPSVLQNRQRLLKALDLSAHTQNRLVSAGQVHGNRLAVVDAETFTQTSALQGGVFFEGTDALATDLSHTPLLLCFADCVPVILYAVSPHPLVAVIHSGWRGTLAHISATVMDALTTRYFVDPTEVNALIGPYIGPESFMVSDDVWLQFKTAFPTIEPDFQMDDDGARHVRFDLADAVSVSLVGAGIPRERIGSLGMSTVEHTESFFSYRASGGTCGRFGACACINP